LFYSIGNGISSFVWSMFGMTDIESFATKNEDYNITKTSGHILFAFFLIFLVIVGFNMLIAMMTKSYDTFAVSKNINNIC